MFNSAKALHSKVFAQNFIKSPRLVREVVRRAGFTDKDTVLEIGPGEGMITRELLRVAGRVVAVERVPRLAARLQQKCKDQTGVTIISADFLQYDVQEKDFKVFSNIPFHSTNQIVKKLLYGAHPPKDICLFTQKEAALRLSGLPKEQEFALLTKPWFSYEVTYHFKRTDFVPAPSVEVVLLRIRKKTHALLDFADADAYRKFVRFAWRQQKKDAMTSFKNIFTYEQWRRIAKHLSFPLHVRIVDLSCEQWVGLFRAFQERVEPAKKKRINFS